MAEWTIDTLKDHFDDLLNERINTIRAADKVFSEAIDKLGERLNTIPQNYAQKSEYETLRTQIENIKSNHVQRREFDEIKDQYSQGRGARLAAAGAIGIIITLITVALGLMYENQITHSDVSNQISREAPRLEDIHQLEQELILLRIKLATHEATDKLWQQEHK